MNKHKFIAAAFLIFCIAFPVLAQSKLNRLKTWIGHEPVDSFFFNPRKSIYNARELRPSLLKLLGRRNYRRLIHGVPMDTVAFVDGYLIAQMCERHTCPTDNSFMAVNLTKGDVHVAFYNSGYAEWFHTRGKAKDLPKGVLSKLWWMESPEVIKKMTETTRPQSNNSFNASGDSVPFIIFPAMWLVWYRAAALIRALCR